MILTFLPDSANIVWKSILLRFKYKGNTKNTEVFLDVLVIFLLIGSFSVWKRFPFKFLGL